MHQEELDQHYKQPRNSQYNTNHSSPNPPNHPKAATNHLPNKYPHPKLSDGVDEWAEYAYYNGAPQGVLCYDFGQRGLIVVNSRL
ncbi:hypothetical protein CC2G_013233 [Coprinopsis cinerea AmutBmut pab1-1]|nr:hypothetical protein CC2G_013233 [Coprinopsis cinerea AmutBmut pab1-1]